jgi:hypothetical protein
MGSNMTSSKSTTKDELTTIAMIGGTDEQTRSIVEGVLESIGIPSFIEGSVVYAVQVPRADHVRARDALRAEPRLAGRWIQYSDDSAK